MPPRLILSTLVFCFCALRCAEAGHPGKSVVPLSITADVGLGNEVFVTGNHADLNASGLSMPGVKLTWSTGNVWSGNVAIESGATVQYQFIKHAGDNVGMCSGTSPVLSPLQTLTSPAADGPPYSSKHIRYVSNWTKVFISYHDLTTGAAWTDAAMTLVGQGRTTSEHVFDARGIAAPGDDIEFVFHNDTNQYDNAPAPPQNTPQNAAPAVPVPYQGLSAPYNYRTTLDVFEVQDGQVYDYQPPASVSAPRIETRLVGSTVSSIPQRNVHIYLPRGYDTNNWKRYPVLYFHDGQNVFFPGGTFGCWDADRIANYEISQGRMREAIIVAVDNGNDYGSNRNVEYIPPGDQLSGSGPGIADKYSQFLRDNILTTLDFNYRTLNQPGQAARPQDNIVAGSSLGGVVTAYIGRESSGVFGKVGIFSPALWAAPNYVAKSLNTAPKLPLQIYMDIGSAENSASQSDSGVYWNDAMSLYNVYLKAGYAVNSELLFHPECGANHNETAWSRRLPGFFHYALSPWNEPQWLAAALDLPPLRVQSVSPLAASATMTFLAPREIPFTVQSSADLTNWSPWATPTSSSALWQTTTISGPLSSPTGQFWRASVTQP